MSGASGGTSGIGLLEVYDVSGGSTGQRMIYVAARGIAGSGANVVVAGFFVAGTQPKRMLIRGIGPGLAAYGVTGVLARPVLQVFRGATPIAQNTGWSAGADATNLVNAAAEVRAFALTNNSSDTALLLHLAPGLYTAQVGSADATSGAAMVEIYELP